MADPRIRITGPAVGDLSGLAAQYDELDRAFGVPEPGAPVNGTAQHPLTPLELAMQLLAETRELTDTANLGRLEELTNALEVLYGPGAGYPLRDAIGDLGDKLSTARGHLARVRRTVAEEVDRLTAACDQWADDYRRLEASVNELDEARADEASRRMRAEEVLRRLEELPGFLDGDPGHAYQISPDKVGLLRRLIKVHTATVAGTPTIDEAGVDKRVWQYPGPQPGSPATPQAATVLEAAQRVTRLLDRFLNHPGNEVTGALLLDSFRTAELAHAVDAWRDACTAAGYLIPPEA